MCGIAGIFAYRESASPVDEQELLRIREAMIHRGPDELAPIVMWSAKFGRDGRLQSLVSKVPARRLGQVAEIACSVLWLAREENTYLAGQYIAIDGGFSRV